ncbi:methionyl-tRNA formyltransferase [Candidatus Peregrinibacteria bacterium HGW-Peregrinibacteria-1]|jgi:methionyl-tRNA formyltransferase|nr:MAG: methionyl-tRNA formyltransferase [Candidatus Peregrinibacteria bacterium HGW-Peregrinibacteria-1]
MKVVFFGTPQFAATCLEALVDDSRFEIVAVVTQPDRKVGRKQVLTAPVVKEVAESVGLKVLQPASRQELYDMVKDVSADFFVVVAYGMILEQRILKLPKIDCINVHGSLLPRYRGASPIHEAILNNDSETGVSIMKMEEGLDSGPVYLLKRMLIEPNETADSLMVRMAMLAGAILPNVLEDVSGGLLSPIAQNDNLASYCRKISRTDGELNLEKDKKERVLSMYRAYSSWPGVYFFLDGKRVKLFDLEDSELSFEKRGFHKDDVGDLYLSLNDGAIKVNLLQIEGKGKISGQEFARNL